MPIDSEEKPATKKDKGPQRSPGIIFAHIRTVFQELGVLGQDLSLEYSGARYRVSCDEKSFMVYRVNENSHLRHHVPGWPVCLVSSEAIFEECSSPGLGQDHYACGVDLEKWLKIVGDHCRNNL